MPPEKGPFSRGWKSFLHLEFGFQILTFDHANMCCTVCTSQPQATSHLNPKESNIKVVDVAYVEKQCSIITSREIPYVIRHLGIGDCCSGGPGQASFHSFPGSRELENPAYVIGSEDVAQVIRRSAFRLFWADKRRSFACLMVPVFPGEF